MPSSPHPSDVLLLEEHLARAASWSLAREINILDWSDRDIRRCSEISDNIISGQRGYIHILHATPDEIAHCADWLQHQGLLMLHRSQRIRARARAIGDQ